MILSKKSEVFDQKWQVNTLLQRVVGCFGWVYALRQVGDNQKLESSMNLFGEGVSLK